LSSSSVILLFIPLEVSDNKLEVDGRDTPPNNLGSSPQYNFEILLVIEKLDNIYQKIGHFVPIFRQK